MSQKKISISYNEFPNGAGLEERDRELELEESSDEREEMSDGMDC